MAVRPTEKQLAAEVPAALASLLDVPQEDVEVAAGSEADLLVSAAGHSFVVEVLGAASPGALAAHASQVAAAARRQRRKAVPLVVVPFMGDAGRRVCEAASIPWFDLSGNAHIVAPGLRIIVDGRPNRFRGPGRPASIFAPKSARVVRWLLEKEGRALTQREIARATDMTDGFVSRIASRLEHESYVLREPGGALRVKDPVLLLDAWREEYRFDKHVLLQGHVAARSGDALARFVGDTLAEGSIEHAATGLAAAWQMTHFAAFRIATFFLVESPSKELREKLGFREDARGANLWLVLPNDAGVFHGAETRDGLRCVHPVQAYVDLKAHPERATEAAERLRSELLSWRHDG
ncbi:MAG: MarR family transcriptional regulator [Polyangiaceae bacterium]|nr:MarR family transcriptional regulator [Polyangiaceae bacterium]